MNNRLQLKALVEQARQWLLAVRMAGRDRREPGRRGKAAFEDELNEVTQRYLNSVGRRLRKTTLGSMALPAQVAYDAEYAKAVADIVARAAQRGFLLFAADSVIGLNVEAGTAAAQAWAAAYGRDLAQGIMGTTATQITAAIQKFASTPGVTLGQVAQRLFGPEVTAARAQAIAVTEITRAYSEANQIAGAQLAQAFPDVPIVKRWATNNDDRVCPVCGPLNQKEILLAQQFQSGGKTFNGPPSHIRCRCWLMVYPKMIQD